MMDMNFMLALSFQKGLDNITRVKKKEPPISQKQSSSVLISKSYRFEEGILSGHCLPEKM